MPFSSPIRGAFCCIFDSAYAIINADMDPKQNKLSTGANVSRTMDNLNAEEGTSYGGMSFSKHNFDKIEPGTGDIILNADSGSSRRPKSAVPPAMPAATPAFTTNRSSTAYVPSEFQNPAPTKKSFAVNKKLIIGLLVVVALVAGGIGGYLLITQNMGKKSNSGSSSQESNLTLQQSFNRFANWMFYGTTSTEDLASDTQSTETAAYISAIGEGYENAANFLGSASTYEQDFAAKFNKSNFYDYNTLRNYVEYVGNLVETLSAYYDLGDTSYEAALKDIAVSGSVDTEQYKGLSSLGTSGSQIYNLLVSRETQLGKVVVALRDNGCVEGDTINLECRNSAISKSEDVTNEYYQSITTNSNLITLVGSFNGNLLRGTRSINAELISPTPNLEEGE